MIAITPEKDVNGYHIYKRKLEKCNSFVPKYAIYDGLFWTHDAPTLREATLWAKSHTKGIN